MSAKKRGLQPHSDEQQREYEREARLTYGPGTVNESIARWQSYSQAEQAAIIAEGDQIYRDLGEALEAGIRAGDRAVNAILERWRQHLRHFYEPDLDMLRGLGTAVQYRSPFHGQFPEHPRRAAGLSRSRH